MSQDAAVALARAKVHGLVKNHIMEKDDDGGTPIHKAASEGTAEDAKLLLDAKAEISWLGGTNHGGWTPLNIAAQKGNVDFLRVLTGTAEGLESISWPNWGGYTPLHTAAGFGHAKIVDVLLRTAEGLKTIGVQDIDGYTPLHTAVDEGHVEIVDVLLQTAEGLKAIGVPTNDGYMPLHTAVDEGHVEIVDLLLGTAEGLKTVGVPTIMPLHTAVDEGHVEIVDLLLGRPERLETIGVPDNTPLNIAAEKGHVEIVDVLLGTVEGLKTVGVQDNDGDTPLHTAAEYGHVEVVNLLLRKGGQKFLHIKNKGGKTPRDEASANGHYEIVECIDQAAAAEGEEEEGRAAAAAVQIDTFPFQPTAQGLNVKGMCGKCGQPVYNTQNRRKTSEGLYVHMMADKITEGCPSPPCVSTLNVPTLKNDQVPQPAAAQYDQRVNYPPPASPTVVDGLHGMSLGGADSGKLTLESSSFKTHYDSAEPLKYQDEVFFHLRAFLVAFCLLRGISEASAITFFNVLQKEAIESVAKHKDASHVLLVSYLVMYLWTCQARLNGIDVRAMYQLELCGIINQVLRQDIESLMPHLVPLIRSLNALLVSNRERNTPENPDKFPEDGILHRGAALPDEHRDFFVVGKEFRVPTLLATSMSEDVADEFMCRAGYSQSTPIPMVQYKIKLDPRGEKQARFRCDHAHYVERSNVVNEEMVSYEAEYLFAPFSPFTVTKVHFGRGSKKDPHIIELEAGLDSRDFPDNLETVPWL